MNIYLKIIIIIIFITQSISGLAQQVDIKFKHLSIEAGLSQSTVYAILQDSQGFLWVGTQDGLNKYDGYGFTVYRHDLQDVHSISHNEIFAIHEDSTNTLWIGTGSGLNRYDRQQDRFIHYLHEPQNPNSISNNTIWSIQEDKAGMLWIGTNGGGLNQFDRKRNQFVHYQNDPQNPHSLSNNAVWPLYQDKKGILWIGTDGGGLNQFEPKQKKFTHYLLNAQEPDNLSNFMTFIYEDRLDNLWIGTSNGIHQFDRQRETFVHYFHDPQDSTSLSHRAVWAIVEDSLGTLWVGTDGGGLNRFDHQTKTFSHYQFDSHNPASLNNNVVLSLYLDRAGTIWVGTGGGGLNQFNPAQKKFAHYFQEPKNSNSLNNNNVFAIYEDKKGILWVGTENGGLNKFDRQRKKVMHYLHDPQNPDSLSHNDVQSIYEDSTGILWVGTYGGGLNQFNRQQNQFISYQNDPNNKHSLVNDYVMSIYEDKMGTLWIGTRGGLDKWDRQKNQFVHYVHNPNNIDSLSHNDISFIYEDTTGTLWVGTVAGGLNRFERQNDQFRHYQNQPHNHNSLSHNNISAIYEDSAGVLWIGTFGGGLNQFDPITETFTHYREKNGLANDNVYGILEDEQGNLWLSTNKGLSKFNPKTGQFRHYDVSDGLQSNEFNSAYYKSQRGEFFFGGINGFNAFYPQLIKDNPYISPIVITDFKIFNQSVAINQNSPLRQHISVTQDITLSYTESFFAFEFVALNFLQPEKNQYAYQLVGFEPDWNKVGTRHHAYYTNVPYGNYTFRVKGSNNDNIWNEQGATLKITILPPPWKTWWAYTLYIITIFAIIFSYVGYQKRKLQEKQQELEREKKMAVQLKEADRLKDEFLANTSHELRTPLNGIIGIAESLMDGAVGTITPQLQSNLAMIVDSGRRLFSLVNDILDFSKLKQKNIDLQLKTVDIKTITDVVLAHTQPLIGHKKVQLINLISSDLTPIEADENRVQQILYNLVGNAIKFTDSGIITVSAELQILEQCLIITVSDTGIGITTEKLERIFEAFEQADGSTERIYGGTGLGLAVTQQLVKLHGGKMLVQSQMGVGSQFIFTLPLSISCEPLPTNRESLLETGTRIISSLTEKLPTDNKLPETENILKPEKEGNFTILVVDDDLVNRQVLVNHLSLQNYTIHQAASGVETLVYLEKSNKPDMILLDVMMPQMSGYEVIQTIRQTWQADELPIILLTAKNQINDLVVGLDSGANDYLTKPISKDELIARIKTHLHILQLKAETLQLAVENEKKLGQILEGMPVGVAVLDANGNPCYTNKRAQQLLGKGIIPNLTFQELPKVYQLYRAGTNELYPAEDLSVVRALQGEQLSINDLEVHHAEKIIPIETWGTPIFDDNDNILYAMVAFQDITERKQAESLLKEYNQRLEQEVADRTQALRDSESQLRHAKDAAEAANRAKSQFLATMSHELRTPLNGILGYAQILKREPFMNQRQQEGLNIIERSGHHLLTLINDILDIAKIEAGKIELYQSDFMMPTFLKGICEIVCLRAEQKNIFFHCQPFDFSYNIPIYSLPINIYGDEKRLRQVIINLLGNAIKFTDQGGVTLKVGLTQNGWLRFQIEDTGIGIASERLEEIFKPFHQVSDKQRQIQGTGLGLAISHDLVKLMGSHLQVTSELGKGSTFWFELPLAKTSSSLEMTTSLVEMAPIETRKIIGMEGEAPTLLIVDDQLENRAVLIDLLSPLGFKIIEAETGYEALPKVPNCQAIITNLTMPKMDGFELIHQIRQSPLLKDKIVIVISGCVFEEDQQKILAMGCNAFVAKPIQANQLFEQLQRYLTIEWIYEDSQTQLHLENIQPIIPPSPETVKAILELALEGDVATIKKQATDLAQSDEKWVPFASKLHDFIKRFQIDNLCDWLESYLEQS